MQPQPMFNLAAGAAPTTEMALKRLGLDAVEPLAPDANSMGTRLDELLAQAANGDRTAFAAVYDATVARAYGLAVRVLRDRSQAEEVAQEAYLHVWLHLARFDPTRGSAVSWILMIVHGKAVSRVRSSVARANRETVYDRLDESKRLDVDDQTYDAVNAWDEAVRVRGAIAGLSTPHRQALVLAYFEGCTHMEVSARAGVPLGTAKSRIRAALRQLHNALNE